MDKTTENKIATLERLSEELSGELENRLLVVHNLVSDAQLNIETLERVAAIESRYDTLKLHRRAHEYSEKMQMELCKENPDASLVAHLLLTKSILLDPTDSSLKALSDIVKNMETNAPGVPRGDIVI